MFLVMIFIFCNKRFCTITSGQNLFGRLQKESSLLFSYFSPFPLHKVYRVFLHFCAFFPNFFHTGFGKISNSFWRRRVMSLLGNNLMR